jgi:5-formyltetrahydrofolate cyclo-ligase
MNSAELKKAKRDVRRRTLEKRDRIEPQERARLSELIAHRFLSLPEVVEAEIVMAFWSFGSEPDTSPTLDALTRRGVGVALPRIADPDIEARLWLPGDPMRETSFGALEPVAGRAILPVDVDVVLTPGVAFDRRGRRVGYGGGFYDRFLRGKREDATAVGVCFGVQLRDEPLPGGSFDLRVDVVVTDSETIRCAPEASDE